ncbi:MAG: RNA polymerase sigma factor [Acidobacteria bacterium]|nr:RNA polymerase sigma factor [Acidobacteriota bacterium]
MDELEAVCETDVGDEALLEHEFEARMVESGSLAFRVAYGVLRHREDAEDVAQEALARAYRDFKKLRDRERFRAWLVRISWRLALDHRRGGKRRELREQGVAADPVPGPGVEETTAANEFRAPLWRAIDALPEKLRAVVVLAGIEGYDTHEVALLLGLPDGTVKSRLHAARRRLAEVFR